MQVPGNLYIPNIQAPAAEPPAEEPAEGIDISAWQGDPDWDQVKTAGLSFAYIKVSEGTGYRAKYQNQWAGAGRIGLLRGGYHFLRAAAGAGDKQADYFMQHATKGELPPACDFEDGEAIMSGKYSGVYLLDCLRGWLERVESVWECLPVIYTGDWLLKLCFAGLPASYNPRWLTKYKLWIANYTYDPKKPPLKPAWWPWLIYQWNNKGRVPGFAVNVDLDIFAGGITALRAWAGLSPAEPGAAEKLAILWGEYLTRKVKGGN